MRAAVLTSQGQPLEVLDNIDVAEPGPGQVLVKVAACGICHSDVTIMDLGHQLPMVLGHEAAGTVEAVGPGVRRLAAGDQVMLTPLGPCGRCYWCVRGEHTICADAQQFVGGTLSDGTTPLSRDGEDVWQGLGVGGFGEYSLVEERNAVKLDPDVPLDIACVIGCAMQTGVGAVLNTADVEAGATVLVTGLGGIGIATVQGARIAGAARIIVSDPVEDRRDAAIHFGATDVLDPGEDDVVARTRELTGGIGVDYAFDSAGYAPLLADCVAASRVGGTTVSVGVPSFEQPLHIEGAFQIASHEKKIIGSLLGSVHSHHEVPRLIALWRRGLLDLEAMITQRYSLDEINHGVDDLRNTRGIRSVISL